MGSIGIEIKKLADALLIKADGQAVIANKLTSEVFAEHPELHDLAARTSEMMDALDDGCFLNFDEVTELRETYGDAAEKLLRAFGERGIAPSGYRIFSREAEAIVPGTRYDVAFELVLKVKELGFDMDLDRTAEVIVALYDMDHVKRAIDILESCDITKSDIWKKFLAEWRGHFGTGFSFISYIIDVGERNFQFERAVEIMKAVETGKLGPERMPQWASDLIIYGAVFNKFELSPAFVIIPEIAKRIIRRIPSAILSMPTSLGTKKEVIIEAAKRSPLFLFTRYSKTVLGVGGPVRVLSEDAKIFNDPEFQKELFNANFNIYPFLKYVDANVAGNFEKRYFEMTKKLRNIGVRRMDRLNTKIAEEILRNDEKGPDKRPTAMLVFNSFDYNGAFSMANYNLMEEFIDRGYRIVYREIKTDAEFQKVIAEEGKRKKIDVLMVAAHGKPDGALFGTPISLKILTQNIPILSVLSLLETMPLIGQIPFIGTPVISSKKQLDIGDRKIISSIAPYLNDGSAFIYASCSTGEKIGGGKNLKQLTQAALPTVKVFAPSHVTASPMYIAFSEDQTVVDVHYPNLGNAGR